MIIISDSSSLILLAKSDLLSKLPEKIRVIIPQQVYNEVVIEGLKKNFIDAVNVERAIKDKKITVKSVINKMEFSVSLGLGEKEALELVYQEKADKILVDDKKALSVCRILGVPYTTVHMVLIDLLKKKAIDKKQTMKALEIINKEGRYSSEIILYYYDIINKAK